MATKIKISNSAADTAGVDVIALLQGLGYTVTNNDVTVVGGICEVVLPSQDLNVRQIKKVKKALNRSMRRVTVEIFPSEALVTAIERYKGIIDECSEHLIRDNGFEWPPTSGKRFSLSTNAQIKWLGLDSARSDPAIAYPYNVPTKDNDQFHAIADAAEVHNMYLTAIGTIDAILGAGTAKKAEISAATTKAAARQLAVDYLTATGCLELVSDLGP